MKIAGPGDVNVERRIGPSERDAWMPFGSVGWVRDGEWWAAEIVESVPLPSGRSYLRTATYPFPIPAVEDPFPAGDPALYRPTPDPQSITYALDMRGLYGPHVDWACGVGEPTVDMWEAGRIVPTEDQMRRLARLTSYPLAFFYRRRPPFSGHGWMCGRDHVGGCRPLHGTDPPTPKRRGKPRPPQPALFE